MVPKGQQGMRAKGIRCKVEQEGERGERGEEREEEEEGEEGNGGEEGEEGKERGRKGVEGRRGRKGRRGGGEGVGVPQVHNILQSTTQHHFLYCLPFPSPPSQSSCTVPSTTSVSGSRTLRTSSPGILELWYNLPCSGGDGRRGEETL